MDAEERDALARLGPELGVLRTRHAQDPAVELLRAARAGVLPEDVQARADRYLAESRWSRTLLEGLEDVGEDAQLDGQQAARLLSRIARDARGRRRFRGVWLWPVFATAAATIAAAVLVIPGGPREDSVPERSQSEPPPQAQPQSGRTASTPTYRLPLDKPPVKISAAALTWRGSESSGDLLSDLKPALEAFRADRYESAERALAALEPRYGASTEVFFYRGVSRLFLNDYRGAVESFTRAASIGDPAFAADVAWYRAVAEERAGNLAAARRELEAVCRTFTARSATACAAMTNLR